MSAGAQAGDQDFRRGRRGGVAMAGQMARHGFDGAAFAVVDADARALASAEIAEKFHVECAKLRGLGTGWRPGTRAQVGRGTCGEVEGIVRGHGGWY